MKCLTCILLPEPSCLQRYCTEYMAKILAGSMFVVLINFISFCHEPACDDPSIR